jgi:hypothetical protein
MKMDRYDDGCSSGRGSGAIKKRHTAARYRSRLESADPATAIRSDIEWAERNAAEAQQQAEELLDPGEVEQRSGEVVRTHMYETEKPWLLNTLRHPNSIAVDASEQRVISADMAGVLEAAADAAETAGAKNSLEKMFCHQMPAVHRTAMQFLARSCGNLPAVDKARLANAAARLIEIYQNSMLTPQKIKRGGRV